MIFLNENVESKIISQAAWCTKAQGQVQHSQGKRNSVIGGISWPDCGSDHELLIAKLRLKLKKVEKTIRPFRYDLNQIHYDYTVEMRNRFKGRDLIDRVPDELRRRYVTLYRRQELRPSPRKRNAKKQNGCLRRPYK